MATNHGLSGVRVPPGLFEENSSIKFCGKCNQEKPLEEFNKSSRPKDNGFQVVCRQCQSEYYINNKEKHAANVRKHEKKRKVENRNRIYEYLLSHPCVDCGETDLIVLEFDHLRDKKLAVSAMYNQGYSWTAVSKEISKCEVRCANCHRRKTARDQGWWLLEYVGT